MYHPLLCGSRIVLFIELSCIDAGLYHTCVELYNIDYYFHANLRELLAVQSIFYLRCSGESVDTGVVKSS